MQPKKKYVQSQIEIKLNDIDFDSLREQSIELSKSINWMIKYSNNEIRIYNHNKGTDIRDIDRLNENKQNIIKELTKNVELFIEFGDCYYNLEIISKTIVDNFHIFSNKNLANEARIDASNKNAELNEKYNTDKANLKIKIKELFPIFKNNDNEIYDKIFEFVYDNKQIDTVISVINTFEKYINGKKSYKDCIEYGKNYTCDKYNVPKNFFK